MTDKKLISAGKITHLAGKYRLRAELVEKDYIMNLILNALSNSELAKGKVFFKGGCCVHKCFSGLTDYSEENMSAYFNERFSQDLDITISPDLMSEKKLTELFTEVGNYLEENHGLKIGNFHFGVHKNEKTSRQDCRGEISFEGPIYLHGLEVCKAKNKKPSFDPPSLKIDITSDETVPVNSGPARIYDPYEKKSTYTTQCYSQEDLIAEKMRALMERSAARDLYDLSLLLLKSQNKNNIDRALLGKSIEEKFRLKKIPMDFSVEKFNSRKDEYLSSWKKSLENQIGSLPNFETFWNTENIGMILSFAQSCVYAYHMEKANENTEQRTRWDKTPLDIAIPKGNKEITDLLIKNGAKSR
ncbi:MAG: nucleotidyl transferase AbiEii/AbiGii toxin family protein [Alphaproteobacteria bacterium]|nr:nucleotidyl transferase AbiEii/AbiGii toxin family protein [Alphaproteobacteria bacterium]